MQQVAIEDLMISVLVTFLDNLVELGCPDTSNVAEWYLNLPMEEGQKISNMILDIQERELAKMGVRQIEVKPECHECKTYNPNGTKSYRCAVKGSCPGLEKD